MRKSKSLRSRKFKFTKHYKRLMRKSEKFKHQLITLRMPDTESTKGDMSFNSETFITNLEMPMLGNLMKESNLRSTLEESKIDMRNSRTPANHQELELMLVTKIASESLSTSITNMISREISALKTSKRRRRDVRAKKVMPFTEAIADTLLNTMRDTSEVTHSMTIMMKDKIETHQDLSDLATTDTEDQEKVTLINTVLKKLRLMKLKLRSNHRNNKKMLKSQLIIKKRKFFQNPIQKMVKKKSK